MAHSAAYSPQKGPRRRLILHVGVQKTGSTAIQRHLGGNADRLADHLILRTPGCGPLMRSLGRAAIGFSLGETSKKQLQDAIADVLNDLPGGDLPVVISHENLAGAMPGNGGETRLFPKLPRIAEILCDTAAGFDPQIVFYSRNLTQWRPSVWAQAVRTDGYTGTFADFERETVDLPKWGDLLRRLTAAVGANRVTRLRLEDETDPTRPGAQLLALVGVGAADIAALPALQGASMAQLSPASTEFLRRLNGQALNPHARYKVAELVARAQHLFAADAPPEGTF
ncbi:hypothetical protein [Paracoccus sp. (in: a-proteobacteria)]|uniref:hypothetical protein n=1 Tax=Paracoccus sp. TaxID=267 RepID=UPI0026E0DA51|nr:hypothetical protein [Paracoccus sp. (in: a-proteobacteria)]MDO5646734.1 hypothetical protein [Paracoccus sp. (in: a-proteobacteria)]